MKSIITSKNLRSPWLGQNIWVTNHQICLGCRNHNPCHRVRNKSNTGGTGTAIWVHAMGFSGVLVLITHYLIFFVAFCRLTASDYPFGIASNFSYGILNIFPFIEVVLSVLNFHFFSLNISRINETSVNEFDFSCSLLFQQVPIMEQELFTLPEDHNFLFVLVDQYLNFGLMFCRSCSFGHCIVRPSTESWRGSRFHPPMTIFVCPSQAGKQ